MSQLLSNATVQEIQLELIKRASRDDAMDGEQVVASLLKHRELWVAVMLDTFCFSNPGRLPSVGLIKLRDLDTNFWSADTMYLLTETADKAHRLAAIIEEEDWGALVLVHDDEEDVQRALGGGELGQAVISIWWD
jgi:hypothetical protein